MTNAYIPDAAEQLAVLIDQEKEAIVKAQREMPWAKRERERQLWRDCKRAESKVVAFREALQVVLLAQECQDGKPHPMPNVDRYLATRKMAV